jgi:transcriptional regulator with GAF, ATPase, and Fis domain
LENARLYQKNLDTEAELERRTEEMTEFEQLFKTRLVEANEANAANPKVLSREGLTHDYGKIIGESPSLIEMLRLLDRVIDSDLPILITGESGTGKELVAKAVHETSPRWKAPFVRENCAAIPATLLESELFGYKKGAFTGAQSDRKGLFEEADKGTIFLDEIGEMSLEMQSKLLRVLQDGEIRPVGGREVSKVDVRLISASNRDLRRMVEESRFREDLFFRLNVVAVEVPPLRNRAEDIPMLVDYFLQTAAVRIGGELKQVDPLAMKYLLSYHWPGNVRELQNEIHRAVALSGAVIGAEDLSREITQNRTLPLDTPAGSGNLKDLIRIAVSQKEREIIIRTLEESEWRKSAAARKLGISRPTLDQKIRHFGLAPYIDRGRKK